MIFNAVFVEISSANFVALVLQLWQFPLVKQNFGAIRSGLSVVSLEVPNI